MPDALMETIVLLSAPAMTTVDRTAQAKVSFVTSTQASVAVGPTKTVSNPDTMSAMVTSAVAAERMRVMNWVNKRVHRIAVSSASLARCRALVSARTERHVWGSLPRRLHPVVVLLSIVLIAGCKREPAHEQVQVPSLTPSKSVTCSTGDPEICFEEGLDLLRTQPSNKNEAAGLFRRSCQKGVLRGCHELGRLYYRSNDPMHAEENWRTACLAGYSKSCAGLAMLELDGPTPKEAEPMARKACDGNDPLGCGVLGEIHYRGLLGGKNDKRAAELFEKACAGANAVACQRIGMMYQTGEGVTQDTRKAFKHLESGCTFGLATACRGAGATSHLLKEFNRAKEYYRIACEGGDRTSCGLRAQLHIDQNR
jgi:hypothetical protein